MHPICQQITGEVSAVAFHPILPWVLYGTEDGLIRIIDYEVGSQIVEISQTPDPIYCIEFHKTQPIFAYGTESSKIHIFNYKTCLLLHTFTDNLNSIRSIEFHTEYPFLMSTSVDGTVRIFNWQSRQMIAILESESAAVNAAKFAPKSQIIATGNDYGCCKVFDLQKVYKSSHSSEFSTSIFKTDFPADLIWEDEAHSGAITSISWNKNDQNFATTSADFTVKIWSITGRTVTNVGTFSSNSSPILTGFYHYPSGHFGYAAINGTITFIDPSTGKVVTKFENPTLGILSVAVNQKAALLAIGHNNGVSVMKMWKERPYNDYVAGAIAWSTKKHLLIYDTSDKSKKIKISVHENVAKVSLSSTKSSAIVSYNIQGRQTGFLEKIDFANAKSRQRWIGNSGIWVNRSVVAALSTSRDTLQIIDTVSGKIKKFPVVDALDLFTGLGGNIYIATEKHLILFDAIKGKEVARGHIPFAKTVKIDSSKEHICAHSDTTIFYSNIDLTDIRFFTEKTKIKSCAWNDRIVMYTTRHHLKFFDGHISGIMCCLSGIFYLVGPGIDSMWFVSRDGTMFLKKFNPKEMHAISAMSRGETSKLKSKNNLVGNFVFDVAKRTGKYDVAILTASNDKDKFEMAIMGGDTNTALEAAKELNDKESWRKLARLAMDTGKFSLAETCYKKSNDYENLAMLYLVTGRANELKSIQSKSPLISLWNNDNDTIKGILDNFNENLFIPEEASKISVDLGKEIKEDWPLCGVQQSTISVNTNIEENEEEVEGWDDVDEIEESKQEDNEEGWDIKIDEPASEKIAEYSVPVRGESVTKQWLHHTKNAGDLASAGDFSGAAVLLREQIALKNFAAIREFLPSVFMSSCAYLNTGFGSMQIFLKSQFRGHAVPPTVNTLDMLSSIEAQMMADFTKAKMQDVIDKSRDIFLNAIFARVETKEEEKKIFDTIENAKIYCLVALLENERKLCEDNPARQVELAMYMTHVPMIPMHESLALRSALKNALKVKCMACAASVARRMVDSGREKLAQVASQALQVCGTSPVDAIKIDYNERNPFEICAKSLKPIYRGKKSVRCPLCKAFYNAQFAGSICNVCNLCEVGAEASGLTIIRGK